MSTTTAITGAGRDSGEPATAPMPTPPSAPAPLTDFAAGATGAVLLVAGVWGLHMLSSANGEMSVGAVVLLLAAFTALGKGITLIQRALAPISAAAAAALSGVPTLVRALAAIVVGATGVWWVMRGHAALWWAHTTGTPAVWTLNLALVQVAIIAVAGALLFGGAKSLAGLLISASDPGQHHHAATTGRPRRDRWASWWSSRSGLGLMLLAGAAAIVALSGYIVPRFTGWLLGSDRPAALAAIVALLIAGLLANTWWWGALAGWWAWAHRPHTPGGGGVTPIGQIQAGAGVVALLWFSATAFGLAVPDSYTGPGAMPRARADCPPDCSGGSSGSGSSGPAFPMQPPDMPSAPGGYNSGSYPAPDQANGISIYNPATGQSGNPAQGGYPGYPQQGPPANGVQPPNYDAPLQPQAPAAQQGTPAGQQAPPAPQQSGHVPQQPAQQAPGQQQPPAQQQPQQGPAQQGPQQSAEQQPQGQTGQQNQPAQQQPQQPAQQRQNTNQQLPKFPSKDKKQDDKKKQDRDGQSGDTDLSMLLFGAVSTGRRRKQDQGQGPDSPQQPDPQEQQGPDTQALAQDGVQAAQGLPGDAQTYVQSGQQIGQSAGQAAQGFGQAGEAGASLASSAQSGAVNPQDVQSLIQGAAQGVQDTADAVNAGAQIVKTAQGEADQVAQAVGDTDSQLKPQAQQLTKLNDQASQVTDLVGQGAQLTSQGAGAVNTVSSLGAGGTPDMGGTDAASQAQPVELMSGTVAQGVPGGDPGGLGVMPRFIDPNSLIPPPDPKAGITAEQLQAIMPDLSEADVAKYIGPLNQAMLQGGIDTPRRQAAFLAQVSVESEQLKYWEELGDEQYFRSFLGDDWVYHGRGPIQLTHSSTYLRAGQELGLGDLLLKNPDLVSQPDMGFRTSVWFWDGGNPPGVNLNGLADQATPTDGLDYFRQITVTVRGDTGPGSHYDRRIQFFEKAFNVLGAQ